MNIINDPGQDRLIKELYVWVAVDPRTTLEGIFSVGTPAGGMQAVTSSLDLAMRMRPVMLELMAATGKKFKLLRFTEPEILETVG